MKSFFLSSLRGLGCVFLFAASACDSGESSDGFSNAGGAGAGAGGGANAGAAGKGGSAGAVSSGGSAGSNSAGGTAGSSGGGAGGGAAGGSTGPASCTNAAKDGDETGVDCGGSCPACIAYEVGPPQQDNDTQSSCDGGPGYMCVRSMLFSPELKQAAYDDWGEDDPPFVYATVGHDQGPLDNGSTCCQCYQLVFEEPIGATGLTPPKPLVVQSFNTAAGGGMKFDVYMAAGGLGNFNGCFGGSSPMYDAFPPLGDNYSGGVKASKYPECQMDGMASLSSISSPTCQDYVESQCNMISSSTSALNQSTSRQSCITSNEPETHYHVNWKVRAKRVECPENLTRVTGCKLNNQGLPAADPNVQTAAQADGSFGTGYETTTMQDCCKPTCAWPNNVQNSDASYSVFYTCDKAGTPATQ